MVIAAESGADERTLRLTITADEARSQRMTTRPPAKRAVDCPDSFDQTQSPGVDGARRQSDAGAGAGKGVAAGLGTGRGGGTTFGSEQPATSASVPMMASLAALAELRFR
jgi:hypothetical protein